MSIATESPWSLNSVVGGNYTNLVVGTCHGMADMNGSAIKLIAVMNDSPGNGDFARFMDDLESRGKPVIVEELWNKRLRTHLIQKRGYVPCKTNGNKRVIKRG